MEPENGSLAARKAVQAGDYVGEAIMDGRGFVEGAASKDLRRRIVAAVEEGTPRRVAAIRLSVREICSIKLTQRWQKTGIVAPVRLGVGRKASFQGHEVQTGCSPACSRA